MDKKTVPIRNIDPVLIDIREPNFDYSSLSGIKTIDLTNVPEAPEARPFIYKKILFSFLIFIGFLFSFGVIFTFINFSQAKNTFARSGEVVANNFSDSIKSLEDFKPFEAVKLLQKNRDELSNLNNFLSSNFSEKILTVIGKIVPAFQGVGGLMNKVESLNSNFLKFSEEVGNLQQSGFVYFQQNGTKFVEEINSIRALIKEIDQDISSIKNVTSKLKTFSTFFSRFDGLISEEYLKHSANIDQADKFLGGLLFLINSPYDKHIVLIFQNPAEIRPGGGFIGSYADVTVRNGQLMNMDVNDIYWPDHPLNFDLKVIPPEPLQIITKDWGARDSNWFFDFPTSAKTTISFLEASKLYKESGITFEGAIGLNINVLESVLELTGPIELPEYKMTIDKNNFLMELQREVEAGKDKKVGQNPKRILKVLTPILLEKLNNLSSDEKQALISKFKEHIAKKDIMFYAKNSDLANFFAVQDIDGGIYNLPNTFWGSYLAVVNANIAGGKSDAFINQKIDARIDVDTEGGILTDLNISRTHSGQNEKDSWWKATNKDYIQIFTNPNSNIISIKGNDKKPKTQINIYSKEYQKNVLVDAIEQTKIFLADYQVWAMDEFGKKVFATWFNTPAGKTNSLDIRYQAPSTPQILIGEGKIFEFIFEKQSGVQGGLDVKINAPLGYFWKESQSPLFVYTNDNPDKRIMLKLTLSKTK